MPFRRKVILFAAPVIGAATLGTVVAFSVPALAASPSPSPSSSSSPSTTAPAPGSGSGSGANGAQGNCPNM